MRDEYKTSEIESKRSLANAPFDGTQGKRDKQDYHPTEIEKKWQDVWRDRKLFSPDFNLAKKSFAKAQDKPFYNLMMFPYPSAEGLHVGNMYAFTGSDIYGRYMRMKGYDVFEPIGLDGFGIHSENYAIKVGKHPKDQAKISQKNFYRQLQATGNAYDWERTLETYNPDYYKWTQWIFIKLFKAGLAYRKKSPVNYCPQDKTVLADEQVIDGKCERCGSQVEKKELEQWFFRITKYADRLLENLDKLDWSEKVKIAQRQWIGKSEGATIKFKIENLKFKIDVFTTRPDTLFGATFLVLAPEHQIVSSILNLKLSEISRYVQKAKRKSEQDRIAEGREKTGVFTGLYAINPVSAEKIPVWIADYVLSGHGTGAIMAVPAHDQRDFEFAKRYKLPIKQVVTANGVEPLKLAYIGDGTIVNSGEWNGWKMPEDLGKVIDWIEKKRIGKREVTYHLRDWLISRQRYWGPPIPMVYCEKCAKRGRSWFTNEGVDRFAGPVSSFPPASARSNQKSNVSQVDNVELRAVRSPSRTATRKSISKHEMLGWFPAGEKDLPVLLPDVSDWRPKGEGKSPLANISEFVKNKCPNCGGDAKRETDVSDTFLDSAWYFLRYTSVDKKDIPWDDKRVSRWLPVDMYIGGAEHSVLHLLYSRFLTMVFKDLRLIDFEEPFIKFKAHGLLISSGAKMSKSKGNIVNPDDYIAKYGADTLRCYLMFCGRFEQGGDFIDSGIAGVHRFLKRVWMMVNLAGPVSSFPPVSAPRPFSNESSSLRVSKPQKGGVRAVGSLSTAATRKNLGDESLYWLHKTIKKVTEDIESLSYNTAIAALMEWLNFLEEKVNFKLMQSKDIKSKISDLKFQAIKGQREQLDPVITSEEMETFLKLLAPFAPYITEELYQQFFVNSKFRSIHFSPWPKYDERLAKASTIELVIQVNGKVRDKISVNAGISEDEAKKRALSSEKVQKYIGGKNFKTIYVPDRLVNLVVDN